MHPEETLRDLGIELPAGAPPLGAYVNAVRTGNLVFTSGKLPIAPDGVLVTGKLGDGLTVEAGQAAARLAAIHVLAALKETVGDLGLVRRVVRLVGYVASTADFYETPKVMNGASELMQTVFGEAGRHARLAVNVPALPLNAAVEIEGIFELKD